MTFQKSWHIRSLSKMYIITLQLTVYSLPKKKEKRGQCNCLFSKNWCVIFATWLSSPLPVFGDCKEMYFANSCSKDEEVYQIWGHCNLSFNTIIKLRQRVCNIDYKNTTFNRHAIKDHTVKFGNPMTICLIPPSGYACSLWFTVISSAVKRSRRNFCLGDSLNEFVLFLLG